MNKVILAHFALFALNAIYGANHLLAKGVTPDYLGPSGLILVRGAITTILFVLLFLLFIREKVDKKDLPRLAITGLFGVCLNQLFFFNGLALTSPMNVGIIMTSTPILVVILSYFLLKERITKLKAIGVLVGAVGAIALTTIGQQPEFDSSIGDLYIFINALSFGVYLVVVKPLMNKYNPLTVITYNFIFGLIFIMMYPPVWTDVFEANFHIFPPEIWSKITFIVVGATFFTYLLNTFALKQVTPSVSGSYIYTQPVLVMIFTFLFAYIGWTESFIGAISVEKTLYMLMIFAGVFMISRSSYRERKRKERMG
ncbi:EamA/RhaT family transporter [Brumimicrobium salinarum]|uniref:EamA/RhaT family transporter n=1 Tax=Brumimicrobium salinarum TaxID=2058658 RepID=A0A2I0R6V1_9FLAO|nr:DMT family transporter [Brumimicrobium salinarum]PKR82313.1 EamA/RhaT family transporter [Brumimicrobium salinarum]